MRFFIDGNRLFTVHPLLLVTVALGFASATFCVMAYNASRAMKHREVQSTLAVSAFWLTVGAYMALFAILRLAPILGAGDALITGLYYLQTVAGAATIISLSSIVLHAAFNRWWSGFSTGIFLSLATLAVYLVIGPGAQGPIHGTWSLEFLPQSDAARILIGTVYMAVPILFLAIIWNVDQPPDGVIGTRLRWFSVAVVMMYLPNAVKYVVLVPDALNVLLAATSTLGAYLGWRSYALAPDSSGNG